MQANYIPEELMQTGFINELAEILSRAISAKLDCPNFGAGNVPVSVAADACGKSQEWVKRGIAEGWLPIGHIELSSTGKRSAYISPKLLWEYTGYVWKGEKK